jgi:hypothetical protein
MNNVREILKTWGVMTELTTLVCREGNMRIHLNYFEFLIRRNT